MLYLNYLEKSAEVCRENFENQSHVLLFLGRRRIVVNNGVDFGATPASAQISMRNEPLTQSNGVVVRKSSICKLPTINGCFYPVGFIPAFKTSLFTIPFYKYIVYSLGYLTYTFQMLKSFLFLIQTRILSPSYSFQRNHIP